MSITVNGLEITDAAIARELPHHQSTANPEASAVRTLILRELLLGRAREKGLESMAAENTDATEDAVIDALLAEEVHTPEPTRAECETFYRNHPEAFSSGELIEASHILFQITEGVPLDLLREKANEVLTEVLAHPERFAACARQYSNCPSSEFGGQLGQISRGQTVPEFEKALFTCPEGQTANQLVETRFGLHILRVERRIAGKLVPFDLAQEKVAGYLKARVQHKALQQYLQILVGKADIRGFEIEGAPTPLVQ